MRAVIKGMTIKWVTTSHFKRKLYWDDHLFINGNTIKRVYNRELAI